MDYSRILEGLPLDLESLEIYGFRDKYGLMHSEDYCDEFEGDRTVPRELLKAPSDFNLCFECRDRNDGCYGDLADFIDHVRLLRTALSSAKREMFNASPSTFRGAMMNDHRVAIQYGSTFKADKLTPLLQEVEMATRACRESWIEGLKADDFQVLKQWAVNKIFPDIKLKPDLEDLVPGLKKETESNRNALLQSKHHALLFFTVNSSNPIPNNERDPLTRAAALIFGKPQNQLMQMPLVIAQSLRLDSSVDVTTLPGALSEAVFETLSTLFTPYEKGPYSSLKTALAAAREVNS